MKKYLLFWPSSVISHNLWDEAYLLGCIEKMQDGKILLITSEKTQLDFLKKYKNIDFLISGKWKIRNILIFLRFLKIWRFSGIYHVWADCLDGKWWKMSHAGILIFLMSPVIARETKIISFSFTKTVFRRNKYILQYLSKFAHFYPRDSMSMKNIQQEYWIENISLASDTSFLVRRENDIPSEASRWIKKQKIDWKKVIMICLEKRPTIQDMEIFMRRLADEVNSWENWSVCVVRHTFDETNHRISENLLELITQEKIYFNIQNVNIVRRITEEMNLVVSCLMHCWLWAVAMWIPVLVLDYFGKATGLFNDLNLEKYVCQNEWDFIPRMRGLRDNLNKAKQDILSAREIWYNRAMKIFKD